MIKLTNKQKREIVELYWGDFYAMNIIDYFCELCPQIVSEVRKSVCQSYEIDEEEWQDFCKEANEFGVEGGDWVETIELDTMNTLLDMFRVDPEKDY